MSDTPYIHVNWTSERRYLPRVRRLGCRKYELVGKPLKTRQAALAALTKEFGKGGYKRGDVLAVAADPLTDYYGPSVLYEIVRRP